VHGRTLVEAHPVDREDHGVLTGWLACPRGGQASATGNGR
jgi:hypothetical protein